MSSVAVRARTTLAGWCAGGLLVAVAATVDPWGFRPFTTARWVIVGVLAALGVAATSRWRLPRWAVVAWLGLLVTLTLATVAGLDPLQSLLGHGRRHLGLAGWIVCALAFLLGHATAGAGLRGLGRAAVLAGVATGVASLVDLLGWEPLGTSFAGGRVGGLLGQPVYLAAFAVLIAPVALGVALSPDEEVLWRRLGLAAAFGCAVAVLATQTRGAWIAVGVAAVLAWVVSPDLRGRAFEAVGERLPSGSEEDAGAGGATATTTGPLVFSLRSGERRMSACVLGVAAVVVFVGPVGQRGVDTFDSSQGGGLGRMDEWRLAARVIADDPLTGAGPEGYRIAAPGHVSDSYTRRHGRDEVIDRAHNGVLDVAASAGLPAAAFYVVLLGGVVLACVRVLRHPGELVLKGAAVGVVAWIVQQAVSFPIAEVDPAGWLLAGMVVAAAATATATATTTTSTAAAPRTARVTRVGAGVLAVALAVGGVLAIAGDRGLRRAERLRSVSVAAAVDAADRATELRPDDIDAWYVAARVAATRPGILGVDAGLDRVEDGLRRSPDDPALRALEEELLVERALRSGLEADLTTARTAVEALIEDDPSGPAHHRHLGLVLGAQGHTEQAKAQLRRALELDADDSAARRALEALGG